MILTLTIILGILVVIFGYTTFNLLRKNENAEDIIFSLDEVITKIEENIINSEKRLKEIDAKGSFKSADEIGWFLTKLKKFKMG